MNCGGLFQFQSEVKGLISFWHDQYDNGMNCEWYMEIKPGYLFSMRYTEFNLESSDDNVCSKDYVLIRSGNNNVPTGEVLSLPILAKQCGTTKPPDILVQANKISIIFNSDQKNQYRGFKLSYNFIKERFPN